MARQHGSYTQLMDDCTSSGSSSIHSSSTSSTTSPSYSQPQPRVVILSNIAATPLTTSPTRASVLESLVPLSVSNVMPRIIISPKVTIATAGATEETKNEQN
ncbi:hypothetical protein BGX24_002599, partial [Mortierella sp. AD032]